jgi:hypothetical protein
LHLSVWFSLLKQWTTSKKEKAEARKKRLDMMEVMYSKRQVVADKLDAQTHKPLHDAKELYAVAKVRANAIIKQQEDLNVYPSSGHHSTGVGGGRAGVEAMGEGGVG